MSNLKNDRKNFRDNSRRFISEARAISINLLAGPSTQQSNTNKIYDLLRLSNKCADTIEMYLKPKRLQKAQDELVKEINNLLISNFQPPYLDQREQNELAELDRDYQEILDDANRNYSNLDFTINSVEQIINYTKQFKNISSRIDQLDRNQIERSRAEISYSTRLIAIGCFLICNDAHEYYKTSDPHIETIKKGFQAFLSGSQRILQLSQNRQTT